MKRNNQLFKRQALEVSMLQGAVFGKEEQEVALVQNAGLALNGS